MTVKTLESITGLTFEKQQVAIKWLEEAAVSASNTSAQANQAENVLRILKLRAYVIGLQSDANKLQGDIIRNQDIIITRKNEFIARQQNIIKGMNESSTGSFEQAAA